MKSYIERFKSMVDGIKADPLLEVMEFNVNQPATKEVLTAAAEKLGAFLAQPIRDFYVEANGMKLHWRIKQDLPAKKVEEISEKYDDYWIELPEDEDIPFAQIYLLPLEDCLLHRTWPQFVTEKEDEKFVFEGKTYSFNDFGRQLKPFDLFSTYYCMSFFLEEGVGNPKALLLSDHYIEWDNSRITDFGSYMEMLLATRGIVRARKEVYGEYRGDEKPPLITGSDYWRGKRIPKLFRKKKRG